MGLQGHRLGIISYYHRATTLGSNDIGTVCGWHVDKWRCLITSDLLPGSSDVTHLQLRSLLDEHKTTLDEAYIYVNEKRDIRCYSMNSVPCNSLLALGYMFYLFDGIWMPCKDGTERSCPGILSQSLGFVPTLNSRFKTGFVPAPKRLFANPKPTAPKPALCLLQTRLCADPKPTAPKPALCLLQNQLCAVPTPAAPKPALCLRSTCRTKTGFASALNLPFHFE